MKNSILAYSILAMLCLAGCDSYTAILVNKTPYGARIVFEGDGSARDAKPMLTLAPDEAIEVGYADIYLGQEGAARGLLDPKLGNMTIEFDNGVRVEQPTFAEVTSAKPGHRVLLDGTEMYIFLTEQGLAPVLVPRSVQPRSIEFRCNPVRASARNCDRELSGS